MVSPITITFLHLCPQHHSRARRSQVGNASPRLTIHIFYFLFYLFWDEKEHQKRLLYRFRCSYYLSLCPKRVYYSLGGRQTSFTLMDDFDVEPIPRQRVDPLLTQLTLAGLASLSPLLTPQLSTDLAFFEASKIA